MNYFNRSRFRLAAIVLVLVMLPTTMFGCSKNTDKPSSETAKPVVPMTTLSPEERSNSTYNPIYMGSDADNNGVKLEMGTGPKGQIANEALLKNQEQYAEKRIIKVKENIYVAVGYGLATTTMIVGKDGITIVDTNDTTEGAQEQIDAFRKITDKPIKNIIYTHYHYTMGTTAYLKDSPDEDIKIIAHEDHAKAMGKALSEYATIFTKRVQTQQAEFITYDGPDGAVGVGLGPFMSDPTYKTRTSGYVAPNTLISRDGTTEMIIDGVKYVFIPAEADSTDSMEIWMPEEQVVINNHAWPLFPNLYTLRGDSYRDPNIWVEGLDTIIDLQPEYLITVHGLPITGKELITKEITLQRDAVQFVYDQTIRYMNKGMSADQIVENLNIPDYFTSGALTGQFYGEMEYYIRGIYGGIIGWFGNDTIELHPVSDAFRAKSIVEGFGGSSTVVKNAQDVLNDKQYSWAAELATYVLTVEPNNAEAKKIKIAALKEMAHVTTATNTRNFYLTQVAEMEGTLQKAHSLVSMDKIMGAPRDALLKMMRAAIDPIKAGEMKTTVKFTFIDENLSYGFTVRNGVGVITKDPQTFDMELKMNYTTFVALMVKAKTFPDAIKAGELTIEGDATKLEPFLSIFDM